MSVPHKWEFQAGDGSWESFLASDSAATEAAYLAYQVCCQATSVCWLTLSPRVVCRLGVNRQGHVINFRKMTRRHILSQRRNALRRVPADGALQAAWCKQKAASGNATHEQVNGEYKLLPGPVAYRWGAKLLPTLMQSEAVRRVQTCPATCQRLRSSPRNASMPRNASTPRVKSDSILSNYGSSISEADEAEAPPPSQLVRSITPFTHVICGFKKHMDSERLALQNIQQTIDRMFLQEHSMQVAAELCSVVIEAAKFVESGMNPAEVIREAFTKVEEVGIIAMKSLEDRYAARDIVVLDGGFEYMKRVVRERYVESVQSVTPLLERLASFQQASQVKASAAKQKSNLMAEMESINMLREANTFTLIDIDESMEQVQDAECNFMHSVLQLANANRQNLAMQHRALRTVLKVVEVYAKNNRRGMCRGECPKFATFVVETMNTLGQDNVSVSIDSCLAMGWYTAYSQQECPLVQSVILAVRDAMQTHETDSDLQDAALFALLSIAGRSAENKLSMANSGAIQRVLDAMANHPTHAQLQQRATKLLGMLVLAACVSRLS